MKRRGFLLAMVMLLCLILLVFGLAFLGSRGRQYQSVISAGQSAQAQELARAGIEDARVKFDRDIGFPPPLAIGQHTFSYCEEVTDAGGVYLGRYRVSLDMTYSRPPFSVACIRSTGSLGPAEAPTALHTYVCYLDLTPGAANRYRVLRWDDLGGP